METRTVKTVRIFLASSSELNHDRVAFADFIERLQNHYESRNFSFLLKKWEYLDPGYKGNRKQDEYNEVIKDCDLFVVIFYNKVGRYTREELDVALNECNRRKSSKKPVLPLFIYFRKRSFLDKLKYRSKRLRELQDHIATDLKHYWGVYDSDARLHLDFVLWLDSYLFDGKSELKTVDGNIVLGDFVVANLSQLSFAINNKEYQQLEEKYKSLNRDIEQLQKDIQEYPDNNRFSERLSQKQIEREKIQQEFERQQDALLGAAKQIAELRKQQVSENLQEAINAFESGQLDVANRLLQKLEKDGDQLMEEIDTKHEQIHEHIEAQLLQVKTVMAEAEKPIEERIKRVAEIYAKADDWASRSAYDEKKYADLLFDYADFNNTYGRYNKAAQIYLRQIALSEKLYGTDNKETATSYNNIGTVFENQGKYDKALEYYFKALDIVERVLGKEHQHTASAYNNIGGAYHEQGDYVKALEYYLKALAVKEKVLGIDHPSTATSYNNIGVAFREQGEYDKALEYHIKALDIFEKVLGKEHQHTASAYNNIGEVYWIQGKYDKALEFHFKALEIYEKVLGKEHSNTATSYNDIGTVFWKQGEDDKALEYHFKALDIREKVLGKEHPNTAQSYNNIGWVYRKQGNYEKALEYYEKAYDIIFAKLGEQHPNTKDAKKSIEIVKGKMKK